MRQFLIAGNWKMNLDRAGSVTLAEQLAERLNGSDGAEVAVCPPSVYLDAVASVVKGTPVVLGAQNLYPAAKGAFTGEISPGMLRDLDCTYVILGHSERRHVLGETDEFINRKVLAALEAELRPIVCVGELLEEREAGKTAEVIQKQFEQSLAGLSAEQIREIVIAYEPVWAIGTGKVASPEQAEEVHLHLRKLLESRYNHEIAETIRIQYGGSVKAANAKELLAQPNIDGALVGGASLKADEFMAIVEAAPATVS